MSSKRCNINKRRRRALIKSLLKHQDGKCCLCFESLPTPAENTFLGSTPHGRKARSRYSLEHIEPYCHNKNNSHKNIGLAHAGCNHDRGTEELTDEQKEFYYATQIRRTLLWTHINTPGV